VKSGVSALKTIPNQITIARIASVPLLMFFILNGSNLCSILAMILFVLAAASDAADGYIARNFDQTSTFGKFADPIADKLLISGALIAFVQLQELSAAVVMVIVAREFLVTGLRILAISEGTAISARSLGKLKTASQVALVLLILVKRSFVLTGSAISIAQAVLLGLALLLSLVSGAEYFYRSRRLFA